MADRYAPEVRKSLNQQFYMNRADLTSKFVEEPGRSDLLVIKNGRGCAVEIKCGLSNFDYREWRENQRDWAKTYCIDTFKVDYWICLVVGNTAPVTEYSKIPGVIESKKKYPRQAWLVPYLEWLALGHYLQDFEQDTIPYLAGKGFNVKMQEQDFDLYHTLQVHSLQWVKGAAYWHIPETHTFYKFFHWREKQPCS